jgi:cellulose biosynthesis protein BcsQ
VSYKEAIAAGLSVMEYESKSKAAQEMEEFFAEVKEVMS